MENKQVVYSAKYNHMTEESSYATISLHRTKQGARDALAKYVAKERSKYVEYLIRIREEVDLNDNIDPSVIYPYRFGRFESWYVGEVEILE